MDVKIGNGGGFRATWWFWTVVLSFAGLWILLPLLFHTGYKPDVIELQFIGKEWVLATRKHPMLPAWILELINILTNRSFAAPFIASALCTVVTLFAVWRLAQKVLSERLALIGTFAMLPFWSITVESIQFNQNTVLMACWTLTMLMFHNAFQTNKKRWWIAAGLTLGLGFHAKYTIILLAIAILFYSLRISRFRRYWKETGPWLTVSLSFAVFLPHLIWLYQTGFWETVAYAAGRQKFQTGLMPHFLFSAEWVVCQFGLILLAPLVLLIPCLGHKWKIRLPQSDLEKETLQYLLYCIIFPFFVFFLFAAVFKSSVNAAHGYTLWFFLGIYLLLRFQRQDSAEVFRRSFRWSSFAVLVMAVVFILQAVASPYLTGTARRFHFPMRELGAECDRIWSSRFETPCPYTSGEWVYAGNAAYTMKDRPSVHFYCSLHVRGNIGDPEAVPTGTWATDEDVNQKGGIILWQASRPSEANSKLFSGIRLKQETSESLDLPIPDWVHRRFPRAEVFPEILELRYKTGADIPPLRIGIALVPPPKNP